MSQCMTSCMCTGDARQLFMSTFRHARVDTWEVGKWNTDSSGTAEAIYTIYNNKNVMGQDFRRSGGLKRRGSARSALTGTGLRARGPGASRPARTCCSHGSVKRHIAYKIGPAGPPRPAGAAPTPLHGSRARCALRLGIARVTSLRVYLNSCTPLHVCWPHRAGARFALRTGMR